MTPFLVSATSSFPSSLLLPALNRYKDVLSIVPHNALHNQLSDRRSKS